MNFAVPADRRVKSKESEKKNKYLDFAWELKNKLRNMKVTVIPIVVGPPANAGMKNSSGE